MTAKPTGRPKAKDPKMVVSRNHKGSLNATAAKLLSQDRERFVAVRRVGDAIELRPLVLPEDTITVVKITDGRFVHLSRLDDLAKQGDVFSCDWADGDGVMLCRKCGAEPVKDWHSVFAENLHEKITTAGAVFLDWNYLTSKLGYRSAVYRWAAYWGFSAKAKAHSGGVWFDLLPATRAQSAFGKDANVGQKS